MDPEMKNRQIIEFNDVEIPVKQVIKRLGYPNKENIIHPEVNKILDEELKRARTILNPKGIYRLLHVRSINKDIIRFEEAAFEIQNRLVTKMLRESVQVILFMITIGSALEKESEALFARGDSTSGFILDAIGSETADAVADKMHHHVLKNHAFQLGLDVTPRFSPGYGGWPLTVQNEILNICNGSSIGISVTKSSMMIPRKSVSAILGFVKKR
jgi:cobalamin-dependent methionine synthase I